MKCNLSDLAQASGLTHLSVSGLHAEGLPRGSFRADQPAGLSVELGGSILYPAP